MAATTAATTAKKKHSKFESVPINLGLTQLYPDPDDSSSSKSSVALEIIAIPGLGANPHWTWKRDKVHWLQDSTMLARKVPNARISVFEYQSQWFGKGSVNQTLENVADQLLVSLERTRGTECKTPIIFVCHCLGGIILEEALLRSRLRQNDYPSIFPFVAGCIFLGTPFLGTKSQAKAMVLAELAGTFGMGVQSGLLKLLEKDSEGLKKKLDEFVSLVNDASIRVFCFFESQKSDVAALLLKSLPIKTQEMIVDKDSATYFGVSSLQLASDHFGLNKYSGPKDGNYVYVSNEIQATAKKAQHIIKSRQNALRQALVSDRTYRAIFDTLGKGFSDHDAAIRGNYKEVKKDPSTDPEKESKGKKSSWIVESNQYKTWFKEAKSPLLWIHGKAGTGQGSIASSAIESLRDTATHGSIVASFFCDQGDENRRSLSGLLKMIVRQIIDANQDLCQHLLTDAKKKGKVGSQEYDADSLSKVPVLWEALLNMAKDLTTGSVYIVLYGLEQLSKDALAEFVPLLASATVPEDESDSPTIKWIILSRSGRPEIEKALKPSALDINLEDSENASHVSDALKWDISSRVSELYLAAPLSYFAKRYIHSRADDNYIYVSLVIQELKNAQLSGTTTHAEFRALMESFPDGLTNMFEHIQKRILKPDSEGIEYTKEILRCMIFSLHAPTMRELAVMADLPKHERDDLSQIKAHIIRCGAFLTLRGDDLDEDSMTVEWIDISAQEHLQTYAKEELGLHLKDMQHGIIALRCMEYVFEKTEAMEERAARMKARIDAADEADNTGEATRTDENPFDNPEAHGDTTADTNLSGYPVHDPSDLPDHDIMDEPPKDWDVGDEKSATNGEEPDHESDPSIPDEDEYDVPEEGHLTYPFQYWIEHAKLAPIDVLEEFRLEHTFWEDESPLRESWWGECEEMHPLADQKNMSALHIATVTKFPALVDHLLSEGWAGNIHHEDSLGYQPLYYACLHGEFEIMRALLQVGADSNFVSPTGRVGALWAAAASGHKDVVEHLLNVGANIDAACEDWGTPLYEAASDGFTDVVRLLLERGANVNVSGGWHKRALNAAAFNGHVEIVRELLEHHAEIDPDQDYWYGSALGASSRRGHAEVVKILLSKGWSPSKNIATYGSFLTAAATYGHIEVVEALVQKEARITVLEQALQAATQNNRATCVKLILDKTPTLRHQKAFMIAADYGRDEILNLLITRGIPQNQLDTALFNAADREHDDTVKLLLEFGASPNAEGPEFGHALAASAYDGTTDILRALIEKGADVNKRGGDYGTALIAASFFGDVDNVRLLVEHGAQVNTEPLGIYGYALQAACYTGDLETIRYLLEQGANINAYGGKYGFAIIAAVDEGDSNAVKLLLEHHVDVNVRGGERNMPVIASAGATLEKEVLEQILDSGADINAQCDEGTTALINCATSGDTEGLNFLLSRHANIHLVSKNYGTALHAAAIEGDEDCCDIMIKAGANVDAIGGPYWTPLQAASFAGDIDTVNMLLGAGADTNISGGDYGSALQAACFTGDVDVVRELIDHGAIIDHPGGNGKYGYPLQAAAIQGHMEILTLLLSHGADVNAQGGLHGTALFAAAAKRANDECVQLLLDHGADATATGGLYGSVIQAAAYGNNFHVLEVLISHGASINTRGGKYGSALQAAAARADLEFIEFLLAHGADITARGGKYDTAIQAASSQDKLDIVNKLLDIGADFRLKGGKYTNAVTASAVRGNKTVLDRFLSMGPPEQMLDEALVEACYYRQSSSVEALLKNGARVLARHPILGMPMDALKATEPDGYNSDDETDAPAYQGDEDDNEAEEDETWEGDESKSVDGDTEGSVTDLNLEEEISEESKIQKLLDEAMARVKRNPSVKRFKTVKRRGGPGGLPSSLSVGGPPFQAATTAYTQFNPPVPNNPYMQQQQHPTPPQPYSQRQSFQAYPGPDQGSSPQSQGGYPPPSTGSGYTPYRGSIIGPPQAQPPNQRQVSSSPSRKPLPQGFNQPQRQYSSGPAGFGTPAQYNSQLSDLPANGSPGQYPQPNRQSGFSSQPPQPPVQPPVQPPALYGQPQSNQYAPPPSSSFASQQQQQQYGYGSQGQPQYSAPPPDTYNSIPPTAKQNYPNPSQHSGYAPYSAPASQSSSQTSFQHSQYGASGSSQNGHNPPYDGTPNSSQTSIWSSGSSQQRPAPAQRWHSGGYDGEGYG
ncbi:ankyrin repeat-containing domain protein [Dendryphion nanum]|uniref:Ankyrin repeat-containing domain protein n=1 Tax=Dendryphion nanum TaxID=256645 RepID=A0A9P9DBN3_9PLEO|nr:ankyrin repeat-containing domain protein [Dendryphion nanum]